MLCVGSHDATPEERVGIVRSESTLRYTYNLLYSLSGAVMTIMLHVDNDALQLDSDRVNKQESWDGRAVFGPAQGPRFRLRGSRRLVTCCT